MLQVLKNEVRKKLALLLIVCLVFCTNSFDGLSRAYADEITSESKVSSLEVVTDDVAKISEDATKNEEEHSVASEQSKEVTSDVKVSAEKDKEVTPDNSFVDEAPTSSTSEADIISDESDIEEPEEDEKSEDTTEKEKTSEEPKESTTDELQPSVDEHEVIATESDIEYTEEENIEKVSTISEIDYKELDAYDQILYQDKDAASKYDNTIILLKDITLDKALYFKNGETLDLAGHSIKGPRDDYAIYVEDTFTLIDSEEIDGKIESGNNNYPTLYLEDAIAEFGGGFIYGAEGGNESTVADGSSDKKELKDYKDGGDAIHAYDSDLTFSGARVYGGRGMESSEDKGGDGGDAIVVFSAKKYNTIDVASGSIVGGHGGNGYGSDKPYGGSSIIMGDLSYENEFLGRGLNGNVGGGSGGTAINIKADKFDAKKLTYGKYMISAGDNGYSVDKDENELKVERYALFNASPNKKGFMVEDSFLGTGYTDSYYSLANLDGNNYVTSLKLQNPTGLCTAFAFTAYAETNLLKKYPDYVKNVLNRNIDSILDRSSWTYFDDGLNLSEMQFGMQLFTQPKDEFNNAGDSRTVKISGESPAGKDWADYGSNSFTLSIASTTWRSLVEEDSPLDWPRLGNSDPPSWSGSAGESLVSAAINKNFLDSYTNKTVVHAKESLVRDLSDYYNGTTFDRDKFVEQAKKDIVKYNGFEFFIYTLGAQRKARNLDDSNLHYVKDGVDYKEVYALDAKDVSDDGNLGGHAMYCIGWDDDIEFKGSFGTYTGAFICKNSWNNFTLVPYDNAWGVTTNQGNSYEHTWYMDYMVTDFEPSFSEYENNYFYDTGTAATYLSQADNHRLSVFNTFEIRNSKEKIKAVSFYANTEDEYDISIYKVNSLDSANQLRTDMSNNSNKLCELTANASKGMNTIDISDKNLECNEGEYIAVKVAYAHNRIVMDANDIEDVNSNMRYTTTGKGRSFIIDEDDRTLSAFSAGRNARIRLVTNNFIKLDANWDSTITSANDQNGHFGTSDEIAYFEPTLRASLSNLLEPTTKTGKVFVNYNTVADGSGTTYDNNSLYHLDIAKDLTLYAQYADSSDTKTLSFDKGHVNATGTMNSITRAVGSSVNAPDAVYTYVGHELDYWNGSDGNQYRAGDPIVLNDNITLTAVWKGKVYNITYELNGARWRGASGTPSITYGEEINVPASASMIYVGHEFKGWYDNEGLTGTKVEKMKVSETNPKDLIYFALWDIEKFTVSFDMDGHGTAVAPQTINYGDKVTRPTDPTAIGYKFDGWYDGSTPWNFDTTITSDKTLTAHWREAISVVFHSDHGRTPDTETLNDGERATDPGAINVVGYTFNHWYATSSDIPYNFNTVLRIADLTNRRLDLYAKFTANQTPSGNNGNNNSDNSGSSSGSSRGSRTNGPSLGGNVVSPAFTELNVGPVANPANDTKLSVSIKTIPITMNTNGSTWGTDENGNSTLILKDALGNSVQAKNMFACIERVVTDGSGHKVSVQDFYYFDSEGKMYTGWLRDNTTTYYFDKDAGSNQGKLTRGWKKIDGSYYYFDGTGNLQKSTITPDGYALDKNGKWIEGVPRESDISVKAASEKHSSSIINSTANADINEIIKNYFNNNIVEFMNSLNSLNSTTANQNAITNNNESSAIINNNSTNVIANQSKSSTGSTGSTGKRTGKVLDK